MNHRLSTGAAPETLSSNSEWSFYDGPQVAWNSYCHIGRPFWFILKPGRYNRNAYICSTTITQAILEKSMMDYNQLLHVDPCGKDEEHAEGNELYVTVSLLDHFLWSSRLWQNFNMLRMTIQVKMEVLNLETYWTSSPLENSIHVQIVLWSQQQDIQKRINGYEGGKQHQERNIYVLTDWIFDPQSHGWTEQGRCSSCLPSRINLLCSLTRVDKHQ